MRRRTKPRRDLRKTTATKGDPIRQADCKKQITPQSAVIARNCRVIKHLWRGGESNPHLRIANAPSSH